MEMVEVSESVNESLLKDEDFLLSESSNVSVQ
jgi:hypothetical protein